MTTFLRSNRAELWLGNGSDQSLNMLGANTDALGNVFTVEAQAEEATWSNPIPVDVSVQRWMTDGAVATTQGHENRELFFKVVVSADNSVALAAGEAEIVKRLAVPTNLAWTPPQGATLAPTTVFELWTGHLEPELDLGRELRLARMYGVRLTAKPWVRSAATTVAVAPPAPPGSPTTVSIDTCISTTGWTGTPNAPTTSAGAVRETVVGPPIAQNLTSSLTRTGSVTGFGATPYLMVDMSVSNITVATFTVAADGVTLTKVAQIGTVSYYTLPAGVTSFNVLKMTNNYRASGSGNVVFAVSDVSRTDTIGAVGSRRQLSRHIDIGGSVETSGSIHLASPSATPLGMVLLHTSPDDGNGFTKGLRPYRTSGPTVTPDATAVSANHDAFVTTGTPASPVTTYTIPNPTLRPATYIVAVRRLSTTATTATVNVTASVSGYAGTTLVSGKVTWTGANTWAWGILGVLALPNQALPTESLLNTLITVAGTGTGTITLDELWLLDLTHGSVTLADCSAAQHLWIDAPDANPSTNLPVIYVGNVADRSDAARIPYNLLLSLGDHDLDPDGASLFQVTDNVADAAATATFYRRWHTHAGT